MIVQFSTGPAAGLPRSCTKKKHGQREQQERDGNRHEERPEIRRLREAALGERKAQSDRDERPEIADADADAADAADVRFGRDFGQQRVVELQAGLIGGVGDDEQDRRERERSARR